MTHCWRRFRRHTPEWRIGMSGLFRYKWCAVCYRPLFFPHMKVEKPGQV